MHYYQDYKDVSYNYNYNDKVEAKLIYLSGCIRECFDINQSQKMDWENIHNAFVEWSVPEEAIGKNVGETYTVWSDDGNGYKCLILKIYK